MVCAKNIFETFHFSFTINADTKKIVDTLFEFFLKKSTRLQARKNYYKHLYQKDMLVPYTGKIILTIIVILF